ncbi:MAG: HEAT repeat domain-containing protein [Spirochaetaceae bacterium]|nr:HEAT repeat domain-containing protein [Spirochaetaceae bacterium]MBR3814839.1 HEAT repeat domain-containing protein [Spirochaetaceae bacterium]MDD6486182.1 HEAT repeat domain-containing protein [Spirochaetales bacterium]
MNFKKLISVAAVVILAVTCISAQQKSEVTVEEQYLSTIEDVIIKEMTMSDVRDNKLVALQYIEDALNANRISPEIQEALNSLVGEGIMNPNRENGRLMNNYPDIRAKAADLMAKIPTEDSKEMLVKIVLGDTEPMVITSAIRSLGIIGINNNDDVVSTIAWTEKRFSTLNPTSSLAFEVLNAYEKLLPYTKDRNAMIQSISRIAANYQYVTPVRNRALELLKEISIK